MTAGSRPAASRLSRDAIAGSSPSTAGGGVAEFVTPPLLPPCGLVTTSFRPRIAWILVTFAKSERAELCDVLDAIGPNAPTLCEGWTTHDLAAHLWIRETDPVGANSMVAKPLAGLLKRRMAEVKSRWEFAELVNRVRRGATRFSGFPLPGGGGG